MLLRNIGDIKKIPKTYLQYAMSLLVSAGVVSAADDSSLPWRASHSPLYPQLCPQLAPAVGTHALRVFIFRLHNQIYPFTEKINIIKSSVLVCSVLAGRSRDVCVL